MLIFFSKRFSFGAGGIAELVEHLWSPGLNPDTTQQLHSCNSGHRGGSWRIRRSRLNEFKASLSTWDPVSKETANEWKNKIFLAWCYWITSCLNTLWSPSCCQGNSIVNDSLPFDPFCPYSWETLSYIWLVQGRKQISCFMLSMVNSVGVPGTCMWKTIRP